MEIELMLVIVSISLMIMVAASCMTIARKARRDRREHKIADRLARFADFLGASGHDQDTIFAEAAKSVGARADLARVLATAKICRSDVRRTATYGRLRNKLVADLHSRRAVKRGMAILLFQLIEDPGRVEFAAAGLRDRDYDVRLVAARCLGLTPNSQSIAVLLSALEQKLLPSERIIERLACPSALPQIVSELASCSLDDSSRFHYVAGMARALWLIGEPTSEGPLLRVLRSPDVECRINAARALSRCGTTDSLDFLVGGLEDADPAVRGQAATALGALKSGLAVPSLRRAMTDPAWWVRSNSAGALAECGPAGRRALRETAVGGDPYAAQRALEQLTLMRLAE